MKVKIFDWSTSYHIEEAVNKWLEEKGKKIKVKHIKQSITDTGIVISIWYV